MRIAATIEGSLAALMQDSAVDLARDITVRVAQHTERLKLDWRSQVVGAGLGRRLGNTVRANTYPRGKNSMDAAGFAYSRAPEIMQAFDEGATILPKGHSYLALPTEAVPRARSGRRGGARARMTPDEVERYFGRKLRLVSSHGRQYLVMDGLTAGRNGKGFRRASLKRRRNGAKPQSVLMFVLLRQVRLPKRLDLAALADKAGSALAADLATDLS